MAISLFSQTQILNSINYVFVFLLLTSCSQKKEKSNALLTPKPLVTDHLEPKEENNSSIPTNKDVFLGNYKGKIRKNLEVYFQLENNQGNISGFYFYDKMGVDIMIIGQLKDEKIMLYELNYKDDTTAILNGVLEDVSIKGDWINVKTNKKHPFQLNKISEKIPSFPANITGDYYDEMCGLNLKIFKSKGEFYYKYTSKQRVLKGIVHFSRSDEFYIRLEGIEYAEDYFDVSLPEEGEKSKEYEELQRIGNRTVGVDCYFGNQEIIIQNYGNAMNYYVKLYDCGEKYIHLKRK